MSSKKITSHTRIGRRLIFCRYVRKNGKIFSNDQGLHHVWPQPDNIAHECELWGYKPEDIDPRNYFEPVEE